MVVLDNLNTGHRKAVPADVPLIQADLGDVPRLDAILSDGPWTAAAPTGHDATVPLG